MCWGIGMFVWCDCVGFGWCLVIMINCWYFVVGYFRSWKDCCCWCGCDFCDDWCWSFVLGWVEFMGVWFYIELLIGVMFGGVWWECFVYLGFGYIVVG